MDIEIGTTKYISIQDLLLDTENYRLGPQSGQNETIQAMIAEQGQKLVVLAQDIATNGMSPFDLLMVCPTGVKGKYRVVEGNRRITSLKLLNQPALAHGTPIEKRIRDISGDKKSKVIDHCHCVIVESKEAAYLWIERKHDTGLEGAGTESWMAVAIRRAKAAMGKPQIALQVIDFITKNATITDAEKKKITDAKFPITNLERILEDKDSLAQLGLHVENEEIVATKSPEWVLGMLTQIVTDIALKKKKVGDIFDKKKRDNYISGVGGQQKVPSASAKGWSLVSGATLKAGGNSTTPGKRLPLSTDRKTLIPRGYKMAITHARINKIYDELRKLKVEDFENAAAVLFRVFVELSADHYIQAKKVAANPDEKLRVKLQKIADFMLHNSIMTKNDLKPIRKAIDAERPHEVLSTDTLNAYVHNLHVIPKAKDLKTSWDSFEPFIANLWK